MAWNQNKTTPGTLIDLDQFLGEAAAEPTLHTQHSVVATEADRATIVGILVDDSGSIAKSNLEESVRQGCDLGIDSLRGAKGSDFYLVLKGFAMTYYKGPLKNIPNGVLARYDATFDSTPLVSSAIQLMDELRAIAKNYRASGIATAIALLLITDGLPFRENVKPEAFRGYIAAGDYVVGMGISNSNNDASVFRDIFGRMGIKKIVTPKATEAEVRHAINEFSQSIASLSVK